MKKPSPLENRLYIIAFSVIGLVTFGLCNYYAGHIDENVRQSIEQDHIVDQVTAARDFWHRKYDVLSHEADFLTVTEAEAKFQQEGGQ